MNENKWHNTPEELKQVAFDAVEQLTDLQVIIRVIELPAVFDLMYLPQDVTGLRHMLWAHYIKVLQEDKSDYDRLRNIRTSGPTRGNSDATNISDDSP